MGKNMTTGTRVRQILHILTQHGFSYLAEQIASGRPSLWGRMVQTWYSRSHQSMTLPQRIRKVLEELGPTFVKLGQVLSTRPDLIPSEFADELSLLQDCVEEMAPEEIKAQLIKELGRPPQEIFSFFDYHPVASASIGQVHLAILPTGERVAVKVQRSHIKGRIKQDLDILKRFSSILNERTILGKLCDVSEIIDVLERHIQKELDYTIEALNTETFHKLFSESPCIVVPRVYWTYTTKEILTTDFIEGIKVKELPEDSQLDRLQVANHLLYGVLFPFYADGIFHGDPHPGNILVLENGCIGLIDFGIVGRFEPTYRQMTAQLMLALAEKDVQRVKEITIKVSKVTQPYDEQAFYEDTAELVDKVGAIGQGEVTLGQIIQGMISISLKHGIKMNPAFFLLGKAIIMSESLAQEIYPGFNILTVAHPLALQRFQQDLLPRFSFDDVYQQLSTWRKIFSSLPEDMANIVKKTADGELRLIFYHRNLQWMYDMMEVTSSRLAISIFLAALLVGSSLLLYGNIGPKFSGYSLIGVAGFLFSALLGGWMSLHLLRFLR